MPEDAPIKLSLTGSGRGGWPLELKIKKYIIKEIAPAGRRTDYVFSHKDRFRRGAGRAQNEIKIKRNCACQRTHRLNFL
jgi:hypothetical protein